MNSDSAVTVSYRRNERRVSLDHGEAFFEVAKVASRPFRVRAGQQQVEALGTSFDVRREPQQVTVTLVEARRLCQISRGRRRAPTLAKGQRLRLSNVRSAPQLDEPLVEAVTAWRRGEVMLDSTPLAEAIVEMNRYDQRPLVIDDSAIAAVKISGVYHTGDSELFASMVARLYGLGVQHRDGRIHLITREEVVGAHQ